MVRRNPRGPAGRFGYLCRIAALALSLSGLVSVSVTHALISPARHTLASTRQSASVPIARYLVLIVLDGARPDYFSATALPHLQAMINQGTLYTRAFDGILEAETPSGHTTLATGSTPARNGILGFEWAQGDGTYSIFSPDKVRAGAMTSIMEARGVPTIAGLYKRRFPHARVAALSGHKYYAADPLGGPDADMIMYYHAFGTKYEPTGIPGHMPPQTVLDKPSLTAPSVNLALGQEDRYVTKLALTTFRHTHQRLTLINYPDFDWPLGHVYGGSESRNKVITLMKMFDFNLGKIEAAYKNARVLRKTLFVITADHGMSPLVRYVPQKLFSNAISQAKATAPTVVLNSGAFIWLADLRTARSVADNIIRARDPGIQSAYYLSVTQGKVGYVRADGSVISAAAEAANQTLLRTLLNGHEPTVVGILREYNTASNPATHWRGDHGGASWQSQHIPLLFSGPGIQRGMTATQPAQLDDIAPTVLTDMGVQPLGMEGRVLTDALQAQSSSLAQARNAEIRALWPTVNGLIYGDAYQPHK